MNDLQKEIEKLIAGSLGWDHVKVRRWMLMPNPLLGGVTPDEMIAMGLGEKLIKTVKSLLEENRAPAKEICDNERCQHPIGWHYQNAGSCLECSCLGPTPKSPPDDKL